MGGHRMGRGEWVGSAWAGGNGWALHGQMGMGGHRAFSQGGEKNGWALSHSCVKVGVGERWKEGVVGVQYI